MSTENFNEIDLTEFADLVVALEEQRPEPGPEFTERLDTAVADHFPEEWSARSREGSPAGFFAPLKRWMGARRGYLLPVNAGLAGLAVIVIAVGVGMNQGGPGDQPTTTENSTTIADSGAGAGSSGQDESYSADKFTAQSADGHVPRVRPESSAAPSAKDLADILPRYATKADTKTELPEATPTSVGNSRMNGVGPNAAGIQNRKVAQEAEITLGTKPENVQEVSNEIVENCRNRSRSPGNRVLTTSVGRPGIAIANHTVPTATPSCSAGPATPVAAIPTSAPNTRCAPSAISRAACSLTTDSAVTPRIERFTSVA